MSVSFTPELYPGTCMVCKADEGPSGSALIPCKACGLVEYCSKSHQQEDLGFHEDACEAWLTLLKEAKQKSKKAQGDIDPKRDTVAQALEIHDPGLLQLMFQKACFRCRGTVGKLTRCADCKLTWHCDSHAHEFEAQHPCSEVALALQIERLLVGMEYRPDVYIPPALRTEPFDHLPLNWSSYFEWRQIPGLRMRSQASLALLSQTLSVPITILYAMEKFLPHLKTAESLNVHVLGPRLPELMGSVACEELFHVLPQLKRLQVFLIGPDVDTADADDPKYGDQPLCEECVKQGREIEVVMISGLYEEFVATARDTTTTAKSGSKKGADKHAPPIPAKRRRTEDDGEASDSDASDETDDEPVYWEKPDLALALNAGFYLYPSWNASVDALIEKNVMTILTAHDDVDIQLDSGVLTKAKAHIVSPAQRFPYHCLIPVRRPERLYEVMYRSAYVLAFQGKQR